MKEEKEDIRIIALSPPAVPMWAVYYHSHEGIFSIPVVTLAIIRREDANYIHPMIFEPDDGVSQDYTLPEKDDNFLGWALKPQSNENWHFWEEDIKKKIADKAKK